MRDRKKFCRPKITKNPKYGDVIIKLKCGKNAAIDIDDYDSIKSFFKIDSFVGESESSDGSIRALNKEYEVEGIFTPEVYNVIKDDFEIIEVIGSKINPLHEYVDLGLPSGTIWATMNIGATSETGTGTYYKYGEITTYDGTDHNVSTYTDEVTSPLPLENDAANVNWEGDWHIPTKALWTELVNNTTHTIISDYNSTGIKVIKFSKTNDSSTFIILPMVGSYTDGTLLNSSVGYYWASTLVHGSAEYALFSDSYINPSWTTAYGHGLLVRAVCDSINSEKVVSVGDIICYNNILNIDAIFSYEDWLELDDDWDATGIYGINTIEEENTTGGEYVVMANGTTFIIDASDYSQISSQWEHVDTIDYQYVDFNLTSGTLWATKNVGANDTTSYGDYFMYGLTTPYNSSDTPYQGSENPLGSAHDTATVNWGLDWHTPTKDLISELFDNTTLVWTSNYKGTEVSGMVLSKQVGGVTKELFLPAAGAENNLGVGNQGNHIYMYCSTPASEVEGGYVYTAHIYDNQGGSNLQWNPNGLRDVGYSIRPVKESN